MRRSETRTAPKLSDQISELVHRIRSLCPDHRNPHRFHEEKSEIAFVLAELAQRVA